jgi:hypothetical protein
MVKLSYVKKPATLFLSAKKQSSDEYFKNMLLEWMCPKKLHVKMIPVVTKIQPFEKAYFQQSRSNTLHRLPGQLTPKFDQKEKFYFILFTVL